MPLNIRIPNPHDYSGAVLDYVPTIAEIIERIPNVLGVWQPGSHPLGSVDALSPAFGGTPLGATGTVNRGTIGDTPVVTFGTNSRLVASMDTGVGTPATIMFRFYIQNADGDFQNIWGPPSNRLLYRDGSNSSFPQGLQWSASPGGVAPMLLTGPTVGWHSAEIYISGEGTKLIVDGTEYTSEFGPLSNSNLIFGNQPASGAETSVALGPMFVSLSDIYGTDEADAMRSYLFV